MNHLMMFPLPSVDNTKPRDGGSSMSPGKSGGSPLPAKLSEPNRSFIVHEIGIGIASVRLGASLAP